MLGARCPQTKLNTHLSYPRAGYGNTLLSFHAADSRSQGDDAKGNPDEFSYQYLLPTLYLASNLFLTIREILGFGDRNLLCGRDG